MKVCRRKAEMSPGAQSRNVFVGEIPSDKRVGNQSFLLAYICNGRVTLVETFSVQPADLMAAKQWRDTKDLSPEVVSVLAQKAHVVVRDATRVGTDGSPIEVVSAF
jgi:hypothetical protein